MNDYILSALFLNDKYVHLCVIVSKCIPKADGVCMKVKKSRRSNQCHYGCAVEAALDVIGNKWKGVILFHLLGWNKTLQ